LPHHKKGLAVVISTNLGRAFAMLRLNCLVLASVISVSSTAWTGENEPYLSQHLEPLRPFIGRTWKGTSVGSNDEAEAYDVSRWERALNGQAVRILHSLNEGQYGGETIITWDEEKKSLVYFYFTTMGFYTSGTMTFDDGTFLGHEYVSGKAGGITEVKATGKLLPDGRLHSQSEYLQNGEWVPGHQFIYVEDPTAEVVFR
jgi:hypothetical protein